VQGAIASAFSLTRRADCLLPIIGPPNKASDGRADTYHFLLISESPVHRVASLAHPFLNPFGSSIYPSFNLASILTFIIRDSMTLALSLFLFWSVPSVTRQAVSGDLIAASPRG
jgi:hypothetical protein